MKRIYKLTSVLAATFLILATTTVLAAPTGSFGISGGGAHYVGESMSTTITENSGPGQNANAVDATVSYDPGALHVTGISLGDFPTCPVAPSASGGSVHFSCTALGGNIPAGTVGTITFKALATGSPSVTVLGSSAIVDSTSHTNDSNGAAVSTSFSITNAPAAGQGGGTGSTTTSPKAKITPTAPATTGTPSAAATPTAPATTGTPTVKAASTTNTPTKAAVAAIPKSNTKKNVVIGSLAGLALIGAAGYFARTRMFGANKVIATSAAKPRIIKK